MWSVLLNFYFIDYGQGNTRSIMIYGSISNHNGLISRSFYFLGLFGLLIPLHVLFLNADLRDKTSHTTSSYHRKPYAASQLAVTGSLDEKVGSYTCRWLHPGIKIAVPILKRSEYSKLRASHSSSAPHQDKNSIQHRCLDRELTGFRHRKIELIILNVALVAQTVSWGTPVA